MFDPYRDWLGITDERRPPTLYTLLGISSGESNSQAIEAAVSQQLLRIQSHITGPESKSAWRLIDEITLAKETLLDPVRRGAYDAIFVGGRKPAAPSQGPPAMPSPPAPPSPPLVQTPPAVQGPSVVHAPPTPPSASPWWASAAASGWPSPTPVGPIAGAGTPLPSALQSGAAPVAAPYRPAPSAGPVVVKAPEVPLRLAAPPTSVTRPAAPASDFKFPAPAAPAPRPDKVLTDQNPSSVDGFSAMTSVAAPKKRGKSGFMLAGVGIFVLGLAGGIAWLAIKGNKIAENTKQEITENPGKKLVAVAPVPDDESKQEKKEHPKKKPPEKKKTPPPKNDPPPPLEIAEQFKQNRIFRGHEAPPKGLAVSPDGKQLLTSADDLAVFSWTPDRDRGARRMTLKSQPAVGVGFFPDGKQAVAVDGGFIYVLDLADNSIKKQIVTVGGGFQGMAVASDSQHILTCSNDGFLRWWHIAKETPEREIKATNGVSVDCVALSADGKTAFAGARDGELSIWELTTGKLRKKWPGHKGGVGGVAFSPDGRRGASVGEDKLGRIWDLDLGVLAATLPGHPAPPTAVAFSAQGSMLFTAGDMTVRSWDAMTGDPLRWLHKAEVKVASLAVDPKDRFLITGLSDGGVQMLFFPAVRPDTPAPASQVKAPRPPLPAPTGGSVESAVTQVREKFKNDYALTGADDQLALYDKLLIQARMAPLPPSVRYAQFQEARDLAARLGRIDDAFKAIAARSAWFEADDLADKAAALKGAGQGTITKAIAQAALGVVEDAERQARPDIVDELFRQRELFPQAADAPELNVKIQAADKRWVAAATERETLAKLLDDLKQNPTKPDANALYGKHLCFRVGEWSEGLRRVALGNDVALKDLAAKDLADPKESKGRAELGKMWYDYAAGADDLFKPGILIRSRSWYEKALPELPAQEKLATGQRISEINKQIAAVAAVTLARPGEPVTRHGFNTLRTALALQTQWNLAGADGLTPEGVLLKADASMTSRFRVLDGCQLDFTFTPDGRDVKIAMNGGEAVLKPIGTSALILTVERKGNEVRCALINFTGSVDEQKSITLAPGKLEPGPIVFGVVGPPPKDGLMVKSAVVSGPVKPME